jgi:hypothetical protein
MAACGQLKSATTHEATKEKLKNANPAQSPSYVLNTNIDPSNWKSPESSNIIDSPSEGPLNSSDAINSSIREESHDLKMADSARNESDNLDNVAYFARYLNFCSFCKM